MTKIKEERLRVFRAEAQISAWGGGSKCRGSHGRWQLHKACFSPFGSSTEAVVLSFDGNLRVEGERPAVGRGHIVCDRVWKRWDLRINPKPHAFDNSNSQQA